MGPVRARRAVLHPAPPRPGDDSDHAALHSREDQAQLLLFRPGFSGVGWQRIGHDELEQLVGGPVRRWHVYDYTTSAVTAASAEPAELAIPDWQRS